MKIVKVLFCVFVLFSCYNLRNVHASRLKVAHCSTISLGVRWAKTLHLKSLGDVPHKLAEPVIIEGGGELVLKHDTQPPRRIMTGQEYLDAIRAGYYGLTTYDLSMESWFKKATEPLVLLEQAKPARKSCVAAIDLRKSPLTLLPPTLGPWVEKTGLRRNESLEAAGKPWKAAYPHTVIERVEKHLVVLITQGTRTTIEILAWADFNNDGFEDLLLDISYAATTGSFRSYEFQVVGRKAARAILRRIPIVK